jgi:hypothetical protein
MKGLLSGCLLVALGYWLTSHGVHVVISERYRQPVFSYSAIAAGMVIILISVAPAWLIIKMTAIKKYRPYHAGYYAPGDGGPTELGTERRQA